MAVMDTVEAVVENLTRGAIMAACQVPTQSVTNAIERGRFPTTWADVVRDLARRKGLEEPPRRLFGLKDLPEPTA